MNSDLTHLDDLALFAWAKMKQMSGEPEESFTSRDQRMFDLGFGMARVYETRKAERDD